MAEPLARYEGLGEFCLETGSDFQHRYLPITLYTKSCAGLGPCFKGNPLNIAWMSWSVHFYMLEPPNEENRQHHFSQWTKLNSPWNVGGWSFKAAVSSIKTAHSSTSGFFTTVRHIQRDSSGCSPTPDTNKDEKHMSRIHQRPRCERENREGFFILPWGRGDVGILSGNSRSPGSRSPSAEAFHLGNCIILHRAIHSTLARETRALQWSFTHSVSLTLADKKEWAYESEGWRAKAKV